jgi:hypothetical protein
VKLAVFEMVCPLIAPVVVKPPNVGVAAVLMFWIVFIAPLVAVKFVLLKDAIPFVVVVASSIVIVTPEPEVLLMDSAPVSPSTELTPPLPGHAANVGAPAVEVRHRPDPPAVTVATAAPP